jgi:hypothetical protein
MLCHRWLEKHNDEIIFQYTTRIDKQRKEADSVFNYSLYFELLEKKIKQYNIELCHTYNMDKRGFLIGIIIKMKRIFSQSLYKEGVIEQLSQDGNREWITNAFVQTELPCHQASFIKLPPENFRITRLQDFDAMEHQYFFASPPSGWTNEDLGY